MILPIKKELLLWFPVINHKFSLHGNKYVYLFMQILQSLNENVIWSCRPVFYLMHKS